MSTVPSANPVSKMMLWAGCAVSALPVLMLIMSGVMKVLQPPDAVKGFGELGWPLSYAIALAAVELGSTLLYVIPRTAALGAILLTGYLGGAIATHVRIGDLGSITIPVLLGVFVWLGLYLRDARVRELIPWRR
jgi:hypothetical protein